MITVAKLRKQQSKEFTKKNKAIIKEFDNFLKNRVTCTCTYYFKDYNGHFYEYQNILKEWLLKFGWESEFSFTTLSGGEVSPDSFIIKIWDKL